MFPALHQQFMPSVLAKGPQHVELLVESLGSAADAGFWQLRQPLGTIARSVDELSGTSNDPASVHRLETIHDLGEVFGNRQITACQFLQGPHARFPVVDRRESDSWNREFRPIIGSVSST